MLSVSTLFEEKQEKQQYKVPMIEKNKEHRINPKTNRMKTFKTLNYLITDIPPEKRDFNNLPRYATKKPKVRFQDWLLIDAKKRQPSHTALSWGWSPNGKCYGWSHRAVYGFSIGQVVKRDTIGNESGKEYTIKTKEEAEEAAKRFADGVS